MAANESECIRRRCLLSHGRARPNRVPCASGAHVHSTTEAVHASNAPAHCVIPAARDLPACCAVRVFGLPRGVHVLRERLGADIGENNQIVLEGTWSARKLASVWQGTWTARIRGRNVSGTWNAVMADFNGKTFEDMLKRTAEKQIGGSWQSDRAQGNWWLQR